MPDVVSKGSSSSNVLGFQPAEKRQKLPAALHAVTKTAFIWIYHRELLESGWDNIYSL